MLGKVMQLGDKLGLDRWIRPSALDDVLADVVAQMIPLEAGDLVLDVECGRADLVRRLRGTLPRFQARYVGIDRDPAGIAHARSVAMSLAVHTYGELRPASSLSALPLKTDEAAVAIVHFTLHAAETHDRLALLRELRRLLRPGGRLAVVEPSDRYDARAVVEASRRRDRELGHLAPLEAGFQTLVGYRLLEARQSKLASRIRQRQWRGYDAAGLRTELESAGFELDELHEAADGAVLVAWARSGAAA